MATAENLEPIDGPGERLLWIVVDAMNADMAFSDEVMPYLSSQRDQGAAWGISETAALTLTGPAIWTLGTGRTPSLMEAVENFAPPPVESDNLFRRLHAADYSIHLVGEAVWSHRYGQWADQTFPLHDRGLHDTHESDDAALWAAATILENDNPDVLVVHLVGPDHVGHEHGTLGVNGPYANRLREIDEAIRELVEAKPTNMSVLVMADHGMTDQGGHGGGEDKPRNAPFVWWGKGVQVGGPVNIPQTAVAPTLAAYFGVPTPAEAESLPEDALLTLPRGSKEKLARNVERQRQSVTGTQAGELLSLDPTTGAVAWIVLLLTTVGFLLMTVRILLGAATRRSFFVLLLPLLLLFTTGWLPKVGIGIMGCGGVLLTLVFSWARTARAERMPLIVLAAVPLIATIPFLRWWSGHILFYAGLLGVFGVVCAVVLWRKSSWESALIAFASFAGLVGVLVWTHHGLDLRHVTDSHWGIILIVAIGTVGVWAGGSTPIALLTAGVIACRIWPIEWLENGCLFSIIPLLTWLAYRKKSDAFVAGIILATAFFFGTAQLSVIVALGLFCCAASRMPVPKKLGAWLLLLPLLVTLLEVAIYLALGKEYTFSSVQVAVGFVGGKDLNLVRAVALVSLSDILPWMLIIVGVGTWALKAQKERTLATVLAAVLAMYPLRLLAEILIYEFVRDNFWITSSILPFMAATLVLLAGIIPVTMLTGVLLGGPEPALEEEE